MHSSFLTLNMRNKISDIKISINWTNDKLELTDWIYFTLNWYKVKKYKKSFKHLKCPWCLIFQCMALYMAHRTQEVFVSGWMKNPAKFSIRSIMLHSITMRDSVIPFMCDWFNSIIVSIQICHCKKIT